MAQVFIRHTVNNFQQWESLYNAQHALKRRHGWIGCQILRGTQNQNLIVMLEEYQTLEGAMTWTHAAEFHVTNGHAGVTSIPEIVPLENVCTQAELEVTRGQACN